MNNETIFYIVGVVLGFVLGYFTRKLVEPSHKICVIVRNNDKEKKQ